MSRSAHSCLIYIIWSLLQTFAFGKSARTETKLLFFYPKTLNICHYGPLHTLPVREGKRIDALQKLYSWITSVRWDVVNRWTDVLHSCTKLGVKGRLAKTAHRARSLDSECYFDAMNLAKRSALSGLHSSATLCYVLLPRTAATVNLMLLFEICLRILLRTSFNMYLCIEHFAYFITRYISAFKCIVCVISPLVIELLMCDFSCVAIQPFVLYCSILGLFLRLYAYCDCICSTLS